MPTPSKKVLVPVSLLKRVIRFALDINDARGAEECVYCSWSAPFRGPEEIARQIRLPAEEQRELIRQFQITQQHDKSCVVTRSRKALGLPNPRAVYVPGEMEEDLDDDTE